MKTILLLSLLAFASCKKDEIVKPVEVATIEVTSTASPRVGNYTLYTKVTNVTLLKAINYHAGTKVIAVPLTATGEINVWGSQTGYFALSYNDGRVTVTETKTY